ncbi:MAG TPA: hypothetical protein VFM27_19460 [Acidimicrobiales bacterium]|nr:hypothetical protein [Acidimicrobiales bacterium]
MCTDEGNDQGHDSTHAAPREAAGEAGDPIALVPNAVGTSFHVAA